VSNQVQAIEIPRVNGSIKIDAKLDEQQWQHAVKVKMNNITRPFDNIPAHVDTEAWLMEDGGTFYLAFIAQDPNPKEIRAFYKDRDKFWGDDLIGIKLDTYNDQRTAYRFLSNPLGGQVDGIENEVTKSESDSWDGIWDSHGRLTETGYIVEMALPYRMLNFDESKSIQTWGMELVRYYPREKFYRLSNTRIERDNGCEICQLVEISGFEGVKQGHNLTVAPSLVIGKSEQKDDSIWTNDENIEPSLDIRWGITPDILLNATINPDFSTVETDNAQLSINNNFALFNQEKRPFFLDNADYFNTNYNLVYTRNINAPNYGAKLTGRKGDHSLGIFVTDDDSTNILIPGNRSSSIGEINDKSTAAVVRYQNNVNQDITLGWISTLRHAKDYHNMVHGIDGTIKLNQFDEIKFQQLYSNTEYPSDFFHQFCDSDNPDDCLTDNTGDCQLSDCLSNERVLRTSQTDVFSGNAFRFSYKHTDDKWRYSAQYFDQNSGFRGDLGFISRVDHNKALLSLERRWYAESNTWWHEARIYSDWDITHNDAGELIEKEWDINGQLYAQQGMAFRVAYTHRDLVGKRLNPSNLEIDGNTSLFTQDLWSVFAEIEPSSTTYINTRLEYGDEIDFTNNRLATKKVFRPVFNWNVNEHLELKMRHTFKTLGADGDFIFNARLTDIRATYQFDIQSFIRLSVIYNNTSRNPFNYPLLDSDDITATSKNLSSELLYAYKINPQTVFYLGYSEHRYGEEDFSSLEQDEKSLFMKFSYAWLM